MDAAAHGAMPRALVADGGPEALADACDALATDGFDVDHVIGAVALLGSARALVPDIAVVGMGIPDGGAVEACRALREFSDAYVIVVAQAPDEVSTILALSVGADDVVGPATSGREIAARARAMLRRPRLPPVTGGPFDVGDVHVDVPARSAHAGDSALALTRTEFELLAVLAEASPAVVPRARVVEAVWGPGWFPDDHALDVHVSNLRRKLADAGAHARVATARGVGFRLTVDD